MTFRSRTLLAASAVGALLLSACAQTAQEATIGGEGSGFAGCIVSDQGGFEDRSFDQSAREGLQAAAEDAEIEVREVESRTAGEYEPNLRSAVQSGCDLTVSVGFLLGDATRTFAEANPASDFTIVDDGTSTDLDNVKSLDYDSAEAAFLAGYVAAGVTETGTVGAYGGMDIPAVTEILDGFDEGVEHWNEQNDDDVELLGWDAQGQEGTFIDSFTDTAAGRTAAEDLMDEGADVIIPVAGQAATGTAEAVSAADAEGRDEEILFVWIDADGHDTLPEEQRRHQLTSVLKDISGPVEDIAVSAAEGQFDSTPYIGTLENGGVAIADYHDQTQRVGDDLAADVAELRQQIIDGELTVESQSSPDDPA